MPLPSPDTRYPLTLPDGSVHAKTVFLAPMLDHPRIEVGRYSYYSDLRDIPDAATLAEWIAPYLFPFSPEALRIGSFCQIASGVQFITASANHRMDGFSTFPFAIFDGEGWEDRASMPAPGPDTEVGHDVWIGRGAAILPGARIGSGSIIGARAVVRGEVPPYSIVSGNPGHVIRRRSDDATIETLLELAWWDWPIEVIARNEAAICNADLTALRNAAP
ncbi:MAG: CatB-related O-acetyltransferase [Shimia sp.]